jgi:MSHA biogenesis protein MshM
MRTPSNLLVQHFGMSAPPFPLTPQTDAFFEGGDRRMTLDALFYAIMNGEGIITVTGEVGCGKTMLSRMLLERAQPGLEVIFLGHPRLKTDELPGVLAVELGVEIRFKRRSQILALLFGKLMELHSQGKRVVLLVDEAHVMSAESLEEIRLITNLDTSRHKLLQVVLFGQQELDLTLSAAALRPLRDRITERLVLAPLSPQEVRDYIAHRLRHVHCNPDLFEHGALKHIARRSSGLMRRVNVLCDRALMAAYVSNSTTVTLAHARLASRDAPFSALTPSIFSLGMLSHLRLRLACNSAPRNARFTPLGLR